MSRHTLALGITLSLASAAPALAQAPDAILARQFAAAASVWENAGYGAQASALPDGGATRWLGNAAQEEVRVELRPGRDYLIAAVCDGACRDLDLQLLDGSGAVVAEDVLDDDAPMLRLTARPGVYTLRITMAACSADRCAYAVRAWAK